MIFKKIIALIVTAAFLFHTGIFLHPQVEVEIVKQFQRAKNCYLNEQYEDAGTRIQRVIDIIDEKNIDRKDILGMCCLLLGAIDEKANNLSAASENYRRAREVYGITLVDGVDLDGLSLYKELVKGITSATPTGGQIVVESVKKKKKFPWLLAAGGAVAAGILIYFLLIKPNKKYQLAVTQGDGVLGTPSGNTYSYKKGTRVAYNYSLAPGYSQLVVKLDGNTVPSSGTIEMNRHHILTAFSTVNVLSIIPDSELLQIPGGKSTTFQVKLSAQPTGNITVAINHFSGDTDIKVITNELLFTSDNWNIYQPVILQAVEDVDALDDEAIIRLSVPGNVNIMGKDITVREVDEDHPTVLITQPQNGSTLSGDVLITVTGNKISRVAFYIDWKKESLDITAPYTYAWNTLGVSDGIHIIKAIAYDSENKSASHEISVNVLNGAVQYKLTVLKEEGIDGSPAAGEVNYAKGENVTYSYSLQQGHTHLVVLLDDREAASSGVIVMDKAHKLQALADPILYSLVVDRKTGVSGNPESGIVKYKGSETVSYSYTLGEGYFDLIVKLDDEIISNNGSIVLNYTNHTLTAGAKIGFLTDVDEVMVCEGQTKQLGVKLSAQPANPVTATIRWKNGDSDIHVDAGGSLIFTPADWNAFQYVTLSASGDTDTENGQSAIGIEAPGLYGLNIVAKEHDTTADPRPMIVLSGISEGQVINTDKVIINAVVTDDDGIIQKVELYIDGVLKNTGTNPIYKYEWNTRGIAKGEHKIKMIAYDICGLPGEKEITVYKN